MLYGIPIKAPCQREAPKSACTEFVKPMLLMRVLEFAATGALATFWFQGLSEGKSWLPMRLGTTRGSNSSIRNTAGWRWLRTGDVDRYDRGKKRDMKSMG